MSKVLKCLGSEVSKVVKCLGSEMSKVVKCQVVRCQVGKYLVVIRW